MGNLNLPQIAANQAQKHQTSNDADEALDLALTAVYEVDLSAADVTLTDAEFREAMLFDCTGHSVARDLTIPAIARPFIVRNSGTGAVTLKCATSPISSAGSIAAGVSALCLCDGVSVAQVATSAGAASNPYDLGGAYTGAPTASAVLLRYPFPRSVTFPVDMAGSYGVAATAPSSSASFSLRKNGVEFGTMVFGGGSPLTEAAFTAASGATFAAGDVLTIVAPASPDATLADIGFSLAGTR